MTLAFTVHVIMKQDGGASKAGTIIRMDSDNWMNVKWDNGITEDYRMGAQDCYDLQLAGNDFSNTFLLFMYINMYVYTYVISLNIFEY